MAKTTGALLQEAEKLARGKSGHAPAAKPGFLRHLSGQWRDPALHARIIALYDEAVAAEAASGDKLGFARYRRGLEQYYVGNYALAQQDLEALRAMGSSYAEGSFPIWLALATGDKAEAKRHLDALNDVNKQRGLPRQKLSDFEP